MYIAKVVLMDQWKIVSIILVIVCIGSVIFGIFGGYNLISGPNSHATSNKSVDTVVEKALSYINTKLVTGDMVVSLVNVTDRSGLYVAAVTLNSSEGNAESEFYLSKDGSMLFINFYNLTDFDPNAPPEEYLTPNSTETDYAQETPVPTRTPVITCNDIKKQKSPTLEAFVVSYCPYGTQMQRVLGNAIKEAPWLLNRIKVRYLGSIFNNQIQSMHGQKEADENLVQISIREEQGSKYWDYVSCFIGSGDSESCISSAAIDTKQLRESINDKNRALRYAQQDFDLAKKYDFSGSPSLAVNGQAASEFDFGGRTSDGLKNLICCGYKDTPLSCNTTLDTSNVAAGFANEASPNC